MIGISSIENISFVVMLNEVKNWNYLDRAEYLITLLLAFFLLVEQKVVVLLIALLGLKAIIGWFVKGFKIPSRAFWPFPILFLIYVLGLAFTENFDYGGKDIETRLSFLLLPLFYGASKRSYKIKLSPIVWAFNIGALVYLAIRLNAAYDCMAIERSRVCFESYALSGWIHPTYASLYLIAGSGFGLIDAFQKGGHWIKRIAAILVTIVFYYFVYKFYSLGPWIGFLGMAVTVLFAFFYFRKKVALFFVGVGIIGVAGVLAVQNLDLLRSDYDAVSNELGAYFSDKDAYIEANRMTPGSVNARLLIWNVSFEMIADHPFGVGTGDGKDVLMDYYRKNGMDAFADKKLNQHCQYLQTAGSVGVISALFLIAALGYYILIGFREKNFYLIVLVALFATSSFFESILERQWGILFFIFFLTLFLAEREKYATPEELKA